MSTHFVIMSVCDPFDLNWVLELRATYHMTPNAFILSFPQPHTDMSFIIVGNGYSLLISHQRSVCLSKSSHSLVILSNMLCVPLLYKNYCPYINLPLMLILFVYLTYLVLWLRTNGHDKFFSLVVVVMTSIVVSYHCSLIIYLCLI